MTPETPESARKSQIDALLLNLPGVSARRLGGVATTREWVQIMRDDPADLAKDMDLVQQSLEYVKKGRR